MIKFLQTEIRLLKDIFHAIKRWQKSNYYSAKYYLNVAILILTGIKANGKQLIV